jgi:putative flippase GtrA
MVLLRYGFASLVTALLDTVVFTLCLIGGMPVGWCMAAARLMASAFNLAANRSFVFRSRAGIAGVMLRYYVVVAVSGVAAYSMIRMLAGTLGWPVVAAKICVETALFPANFFVIREYVFPQRTAAAE